MGRLSRLTKLFLTLFIILIMGMISVSAAVYAEYTPSQSLYFKRPPPPFTSDTMFGTKLGQFKIWSDDGNIYTPVVTVTPDAYSTAIKMTGPYSWTPPNNYKTATNIAFNVIFLAYRQGSDPATGHLSQPWSDSRVAVAGDIANVQGTSDQPFLVDIYLMNTNIISGIHGIATLGRYGAGFLLNAAYTFNAPFNPSFGLATADNPNTFMYSYMNKTEPRTTGNNTGAYVTVESPSGNNTGYGTTPIVDPGGMSGGEPGQGDNGGIIYGDEPEPDPVINTLFSLADNEVSITLSDYTGSQVRKINSATLGVTVLYGLGTEMINVDITFTDNSPASLTGFHLLHETPGPTIPYNLFWGNTMFPITKGSAIPLNNLIEGIHTNDIYMGQIDETAVNQAASGIYTSTVTVTITNRD